MFGLNRKSYIFIYGNLLPEDPSGQFTLRALKDHLTYVGPAQTSGTMYLIKDVEGNEEPAITFSEGDGTVFGELYLLNDARALEVVDAIEYSQHLPQEKCLYLRRQVKTVCCDSGKAIRAWAYDLNLASEAVTKGRTEVLEIIPSGSWADYLKKQEQAEEQAGNSVA